jgi:hypothetical protein
MENFFPLKDYPKSNKKQVKAQLEKEGYTHVAYSGKMKGFYAYK